MVTGVYPALVVTDARCHGSAVGISKKQLWTLFSLDESVAFSQLDVFITGVTIVTAAAVIVLFIMIIVKHL